MHFAQSVHFRFTIMIGKFFWVCIVIISSLTVTTLAQVENKAKDVSNITDAARLGKGTDRN